MSDASRRSDGLCMMIEIRIKYEAWFQLGMMHVFSFASPKRKTLC